MATDDQKEKYLLRIVTYGHDGLTRSTRQSTILAQRIPPEVVEEIRRLLQRAVEEP